MLPLLRAQEALEEAKRRYVAPDPTVLHCKLARAWELCSGGGSGRAREREGITLDYLAVGPTGHTDQWGSEASRGRGGAGGRGACAPDPIGRLPARGGRVGSERAAGV